MATTSYTTDGQAVPAASDYQPGAVGAASGPAATGAGMGAGGSQSAQERTYDAQSFQGDPTKVGGAAGKPGGPGCGWACVAGIAVLVVAVVMIARGA